MTEASPTNQPVLVATRIAKVRLGVCGRTLANWRKRAKIGFAKTAGGHYRYAVDAFLAAQSAGAASPPEAAKE